MSARFPPVTDAVYDRGIAVGVSNIRDDTMSFRFRDELFTFPTTRVFGVAKFNGYWYEADIEDLRMLEAAGTA